MIKIDRRASMWERRNTYPILVRKSERKGQLKILKWEDNIKMYLI
jgi:hypothetical protein